ERPQQRANNDRAHGLAGAEAGHEQAPSDHDEQADRKVAPEHGEVERAKTAPLRRDGLHAPVFGDTGAQLLDYLHCGPPGEKIRRPEELTAFVMCFIFPPLALPRSGSAVGDGSYRPLSPW